MKGSLAFPWTYGVVLTHISRRQFDAAGLSQAIEGHRVVCFDEMTDMTEAEDFQRRLWGMFPRAMRGALSLPQIDRVRWILFPEVRVNTQMGLFPVEDTGEVPDIIRVMNLQQEQLAPSLGDVHRVIHGVAGSGKTMILGYRAEQLAKSVATAKPILVLCYNEPLAVKLASVMAAKGLTDNVLVRHFHKWCRQQLVAFGQPIPQQGPSMFEQMVDNVIRAVERRQIPSGQYRAVLIDEGHDFQPEWLKLVTQMVDPNTNSLLLLYDDAQSIYERKHTRQFSFKSVGIQAQGRTTILKINYRNTRQVLQTASMIAGDLLEPEEQDDDGVPMLKPISCGRDGHAPFVIRLPTLRDEAKKIADLLSAAHMEGSSLGGRDGNHLPAIRSGGGMRGRPSPAKPAPSGSQRIRHFRSNVGFNQSADHARQQRARISDRRVARCWVYARRGRGRIGRGALVLCCGDGATQSLFITLSGDGAFSKRFGQ